RASAGKDHRMQLARELSRKVYVRSRMARTLALRMAYIAYSRALLRWSDPPTPEAAASLRSRIERLFEEDWQDAEEGIYPRELIEALPVWEYARAMPRLLADLPRTRARFARAQHASPDQPLRLLDVACGTGHLLRMLGAALPHEAKFFGVDLPPQYIARAREILPRDLDVSLVCDNAEKLPFLDGSFDVATSAYLLHELPPEVRSRVLTEMPRVVRPGGLVVVADSIQLADAPEPEREILAFPARFHEPYYTSYVKDDLGARVSQAGLR